MMDTLTTFSARDAKAKFGEVLDTALGRPVGITKHDRLTAYMVSKAFFDSMMKKIETLEDQLWLQKAEAAREEGFADAGDVTALLDKVRMIGNESKNDQAGPEVHGGAGRETI